MRARDVALVATVLAAAGPAVTVAGAASAPRFGLEDQLRVGRDPLRLVAADFDQDGNPDLATANYHGGSVSVLIGHGDGSFAPQVVHRVAKEPAAIEAGDVDEDGRPDLIVASLNDPGSLTVLLHRDGGRFEKAGEYKAWWTNNVAVGDVDEDGHLDLVTDDGPAKNFAVLPGRGNGEFGRKRRVPGGLGAEDVALGDLNGDGHLDAVFSGARSVGVQVGTGDGRFGPLRRYRSGPLPFDVDLADVNEDGHLDAIAANYTDDESYTPGFVSVLLGAGDGTLLPRTTYATGSGSNVDAVVIADYDRDGHLDVAAPAWGGPVVRRGAGDGTFGDQRSIRYGLCTGGGTTADFDRDGWPDLAFTNSCVDDPFGPYATRVQVLRNRTDEPCAVPDVVSKPIRTARALITGAGCAVGTVTRRRSSTARRGRVLAQDPAPDTVLALDSPIDLVVARR